MTHFQLIDQAGVNRFNPTIGSPNCPGHRRDRIRIAPMLLTQRNAYSDLRTVEDA